jgi:hypothetical protein
MFCNIHIYTKPLRESIVRRKPLEEANFLSVIGECPYWRIECLFSSMANTRRKKHRA